VTSACKQAMWGESHDFIYLEIRNYDKYLEKVAELYRAGHSLRDIAKQIDLSKTKIRDLMGIGTLTASFKDIQKSILWF
jgi:hypothetical protein